MNSSWKTLVIGLLAVVAIGPTMLAPTAFAHEHHAEHAEHEHEHQEEGTSEEDCFECAALAPMISLDVASADQTPTLDRCFETTWQGPQAILKRIGFETHAQRGPPC